VRICFLSAEFSPFAKTGGLGDVSAALTRHLAGRGHDLRVFVPLHGQMDLRGVDRHPVDFLQGLSLRVGAREFHYGVQTARVPDSGLWVYLVDCPSLFDRPRIYSDAPDEHVRYLMLTRAALEGCQRMGFAPQILHANDWHTAFAPLLLRSAYAWDRGLFASTRSTTWAIRACSARASPGTSARASNLRSCTRRTSGPAGSIRCGTPLSTPTRSRP
jgi:starch synthase